jgi:hypothetical protein
MKKLTMHCFIICVHLIFIGWSKQGGCDRQAWAIWLITTKFWSVNLRGRDHSEEVGVRVMVILKQICKIRTTFIGLRWLQCLPREPDIWLQSPLFLLYISCCSFYEAQRTGYLLWRIFFNTTHFPKASQIPQPYVHYRFQFHLHIWLHAVVDTQKSGYQEIFLMIYWTKL